VQSICPSGLEIEIEGYGEKWKVDIPHISLLTGIAHACCLLTGEPVTVDERFLKRVTLTGLDEKKKQVKVRIAPAH